ncbi:MAG: DNA polymerase IV [Pseudomonadota bacterium]
MQTICRDCLASVAATEARCPQCHGPRLIGHRRLHELSIAHLDCDSFYAAVEKRDNPELADKPVIIGGGTRGVVSTACYVARIQGVRSAMPMFKALKACPKAVVIKPDMAKYARVGKQVRELMKQLTPLVEPISIDEAFMDLTGTERLHGKSPVRSLCELALKIEDEIGITVSIGLSHTKYLAKLASDMDKPRGMFVIGPDECVEFLRDRPVSFIWGVGAAMQKKLHRDGIRLIGQLQRMEKNELMRQYGSLGSRLYHLSRGEDARSVQGRSASKSISAETTFNTDISDYRELERRLWRLSEKVSRRAKKEHMAGATVVLKLKTDQFKTRTRNTSLSDPTALATRIFDAAKPMLHREVDGKTAFRLLGVGITGLSELAAEAEIGGLDLRADANAKVELAMDKLRDKFGTDAVEKGRGLKGNSR